MSASTTSMLDFFRWNCSWYISGITKGNDRSQSIPSRTYDLWPARPFVIVVRTTDLGKWIIVSSSWLAMSSFDFIFFWMEGLIKQTMLIPYESQRRKDMNKCFKNWLQSCTMTNSLTLEPFPSTFAYLICIIWVLLHKSGRWYEPLLYFKLVLCLNRLRCLSVRPDAQNVTRGREVSCACFEERGNENAFINNNVQERSRPAKFAISRVTLQNAFYSKNSLMYMFDAHLFEARLTSCCNSMIQRMSLFFLIYI